MLAKMVKAQSALEFLSGYIWAFIIIAIILGVIYYLLAIPSSVVPTSCNINVGVYCKALIVGSAAGTTHFDAVIVDSEQYDLIAPTSVIFNVSGYGNVIATCNPSSVISGGATVCGGSLSTAIPLSTKVSGLVKVSTSVCLSGNVNHCSSVAPTLYTGNFSSEVGTYTSNIPVSVALYVTSTSASVGSQDLVTANIKMLNVPASNAGLAFTTNLPTHSTVSPEYVLTNQAGNATAEFSATVAGTYNVIATYGNYIASNIITVT